ncbi:putative DNA-binding transcriptional regulator YafY [Nocardia neocaledoniensis]|uniref:Putative DNA-binding transcriptional regulator YafY n=2 Tax=Nocardia neocaledoniensis TaxID=236511 RepID=A0A317P311_9NOCA|nr:putative DNA-binding transcriptional regulator YafY [Nocardia neocaledoniensis]
MAAILENMADTSARTLRLLSLLQTHRYWPGTELSERLGVSARTLRRDIDRLRELGYPVHARPGVDGGYQLAAGAALPPLVLDDDEAVAITVCLQAGSQGAADGLAEPSVRALAKLVTVLPTRLRRRVDALRAMTISTAWNAVPLADLDPAVLTDLAMSCRVEERLTFTYTAADGRTSTREVEPHRLVSLGRRWYLVAYDLTRHDWRTFRVDRLSDSHTTGVRFRPRDLPAADAATFVRDGIGFGRTLYTVHADLEAPAPDITTRVGRWCTVTPLTATRTHIEMTVDNLDWPLLVLGRAEAPFTIHEPPELLARVAEWGARFTASA